MSGDGPPAVLREAVRARVRAALEAEIEASTAIEPGVVTEDDVRRWTREGRVTNDRARLERTLEQGRLTPLARETLSEALRAAPLVDAASAPRAAPEAATPRPLAPAAAPPASTSNVAFETIAVGADHGGYPLKEEIARHLRERGFHVLDCGTDSTEACDYPVFAQLVAERVRQGEAVAGVVVDGAGIGSAMAANKVPGIRAAHCHNTSEARNAREHNHAHIVTLGSGFVGPLLAKEIVDRFLATPFGEGRHARRVALMESAPLPERSARG